MKKRSKPILCIVISIILTAFAFVQQTSAADKPLTHTAAVIAEVNASDNDTKAYLHELEYDHGYIPTISTYQNPDGSYAVCVQQADNTLKIFELDTKGTVENSFTVNNELDCFAAFTKGVDGSYYILFSQKLTKEQQEQTALRLVNYSASGERLRELNIAGNGSGSYLGIAETFCGNNVLSANANIITGYIAREMFPSDGEGSVHQASYAFAVSLNTFTQIKVKSSAYIPYASHSFHQFILQDGNDFVYVDRSDALPFRSFRVSKMSGNKWEKDPNTYTGLANVTEKEYERGNSFRFKGNYASNHTYSQLGGIVKTNNGYMLAGTYQNTTDAITPSSANVFVQLFDTSTLKAQKEIYLTDYAVSGNSSKDITATATNPKIVSINSNSVLIPYMLSDFAKGTNEVRIAFVDGSGKLTENKAVEAAEGGTNLPRLGNVYYCKQTASVNWFGIVGGKLVMNTVIIDSAAAQTTTAAPAESTTVPDSSTQTTTTTDPAEATTQPTTVPVTEATTQPETEPVEPPAEPGFFQRVLNFFISIYNWFVSLFS